MAADNSVQEDLERLQVYMHIQGVRYSHMAKVFDGL